MYLTRPQSVRDILILLEQCEFITGCEPDMTVLAHSLCCADVLRDSYPDNTKLQVAGLLHDVGHLAEGDTASAHPLIAADLFSEAMPSSVCNAIRLHSDAKRYLVASERGYQDTLSVGSSATLLRQGGPMPEGELQAFLRKSGSREAIALRRADEAAKNADAPHSELGEWEACLRLVANK